jgi:formylmethanofuran dehydrogenase subunit E
VALRWGITSRDEEGELPDEERRARSLQRLQTLPDEELFDIRWVDAPLPGPAQIFRSVRCHQCGEAVMEARAHLREGQAVCPECYGEAYTRRF